MGLGLLPSFLASPSSRRLPPPFLPPHPAQVLHLRFLFCYLLLTFSASFRCTPHQASAVIQALNGLPMGDRSLKVSSRERVNERVERREGGQRLDHCLKPLSVSCFIEGLQQETLFLRLDLPPSVPYLTMSHHVAFCHLSCALSFHCLHVLLLNLVISVTLNARTPSLSLLRAFSFFRLPSVNLRANRFLDILFFFRYFLRFLISSLLLLLFDKYAFYWK